MTTRQLSKPLSLQTFGPAVACACVHIVADMALRNQAWFLTNRMLMLALALPLSQCSLCAIWAATSRVNLYVRFAVPFVATIACWFVLTHFLPWGIDRDSSAGWVVTMAVQSVVIVATVDLYQRVQASLSKRKGNSSFADRPNALSFDLRTMMMWTTIIALSFGFVQFGRIAYSWSGGAIARWEYIMAMPAIGLFNALVALLWLWVITAGCWKWRSIRFSMAATLIGVASYALPYLLGWLTIRGIIEARDGYLLGVAQSIYLLASFAIFAIAASYSTQNVG